MRRLYCSLSIVAVVYAVVVAVCLPDPPVGLRFDDSMSEVSVRQVVEPSGHFHLEVLPKDAAAKFTHMTIGGIPVFSREWLVYSVASTAPLGESEIVDFPRFFDLLPKLFRLGRIGIALFPLFVLFFVTLVRYVVPILSRTCGRKSFVVALIITSLLSLPEPIMDVAPGLDPSWSWFLCRFAFDNVFGSDVVFTYGPLGFLLVPQGWWACVLCSLVANLLFVVLWIRLSLQIYNWSDSGHGAAWVLVGSTIIPMPMEWRWVVLAVLYSDLSIFDSRKGGRQALYNWCLAGMLAAFVSMVKFSSLTIVVGSQLFCLVAYVWRLRKDAVRVVVVYIAALLVTGTVLSVMCFSSFSAWVAWIHGSLATASGYNLYMVAEKQWLELLIPVVIGLAFMYAVGWRRVVLFLPILFLTAKYAWVRQSSVPMAYLAMALAAVCLLDGGRRMRRVVALLILAFFWSVATSLPSALSGLSSLQSLCGWRPAAFYHSLFLPLAVSDSFTRSDVAVANSQMPPSWRSRVGGGDIVFLPSEHSPAMADDTLKVKPFPSLQLYSACHPYLDALNAEFFARGIPEFIMCGITAGGTGHFINYPRTWIALLENYECVEANEDFALLQRSKSIRPRPKKSITLSNELSFFEKLRGFFFRNPMEYAFVVDKEGRCTRFQLVRGNQGVPFPLEWIPFDEDDMLNILRGGKGRVKRVDLREQAAVAQY